MSQNHIKIISDYRDPHPNEFFFTFPPKNTSGIRELLEYIEDNTDIKFVPIEGWKFKSVIKSSYGDHYEDREKHGLKVILE